jgi:6-phosphogluconolactonase (cycloisomerase 2 family)
VKLEINATYIAIDPAEKFAYVAHYFGVSVFGMDSRTGKLDLRKTIKTQGECPYSIGMDPHGKFVFVTNGNGASPTNGPGLVSAFGVNSKTGLLTAKGSADAEINPDKIVVHPTGKFVYVVNENSGTVSMFAVNQANGTMASLGATGAKGHRRVIAIHPSGRFVYVPEGSSVFSHVLSSGELRSDINGSNAVSIFSVNQETGALVAKGEVGAGEEVKPGSTPSSVVVHPNGKFLYVTNSESNNVSIYAINPETGALTIPGG